MDRAEPRPVSPRDWPRPKGYANGILVPPGRQMLSLAGLGGWDWSEATALLKAENVPVGYQREAKEGSATWFCGYVNAKDGPGSEEKAHEFAASFLRRASSARLVRSRM